MQDPQIPDARVVTRDGLTTFVYGPFEGIEMGAVARQKLARALELLDVGMVREVECTSDAPEGDDAEFPNSVLIAWEPTQQPDRHSARDLEAYIVMYVMGCMATMADERTARPA